MPFLSVVTWDQCCRSVFAKTKYFHVAELTFPLIRWLFPCLWMITAWLSGLNWLFIYLFISTCHWKRNGGMFVKDLLCSTEVKANLAGISTRSSCSQILGGAPCFGGGIFSAWLWCQRNKVSWSQVWLKFGRFPVVSCSIRSLFHELGLKFIWAYADVCSLSIKC